MNCVAFDTDIPAGNGILKRQEGHHLYVSVDLRDTPRDWFYWRFRLTFHEEGTYQITFVDNQGCCLTERGPAVSTDQGKTWHWLTDDAPFHSATTFDYRHDGPVPAQVWFCTSIQYLPHDLHSFLKDYQHDSRLQLQTLCHSRKGRTVPLLAVQDPRLHAPQTLFLTSRHHCCEMTATYVLEGILREALDNQPFLQQFKVLAVPFVDMDGVVDGDQGKWRTPHDHNRDYTHHPIYPETAAIMQLVRREQPTCMLDLHCPYVCGAEDSRIFLYGEEDPEQEGQNVRFSHCLEQEPSRNVPYCHAHEVLFGTPFNNSHGSTEELSCSTWGALQDFVKLAATFEIPYANSGDFTFTPDRWRSFGRSMARALLTWNNG